MQNKRVDVVELKFGPSEIDAFITEMKDAGLADETLKNYRYNLLVLFDFLPENKCLDKDILEQWPVSMKEAGYAPRSINARISAANRYLEYIGRRDLQFVTLEKLTPVETELTRREYLRLLSTAKILEKDRVYLLIKILGTTGITVQQLLEMTVEVVNAGWVGDVRLSRGLQQELLKYAKRKGILHGPLFKTEAGHPIDRTYVTHSIRTLSAEANVDPGKANPRYLQKLYQKTRAEIEQELALLMEERYDNLLDAEQKIYGWE